MKTTYFVLALAWFGVNTSPAQVAQTKPAPIAPIDGSVSYQVVERGPHHKIMQRVTWATNAAGAVTASTNSYTELTTGMHYSEGDKWLESEAKIEILPNNTGAIASKGQPKVIFPPEIKSGVIELNTPDNQWLRSRVWGLAYFDASTGDSLLLAEVQASDGQLVGDNIVIYPNAFTDFRADIRYKYTIAGFEQDVVLREQPPSPKEFGLNPKTTRLQVLTEFVEAPSPAKESRQAGGLADEALSFGEMGIGQGKAFSVDAAGDMTGQVPVAKGWTPIEGRNFLIEEVHYEKVAEQLQKLPAAGKYQGASLLRRGTGENVIAGLKKLMPKRYAKVTPKPGTKRMAKVSVNSAPSFVMDYLVTLTSQANFTFKGDTTYYVSGSVNLSGTTTIEGGAVMKFTNSSAIVVSGALVCQTGPYRPAVFTSKNDNSVGETISGSSGSPTIITSSTYLYAGANSNPFKYLNFRYAGTGLMQSYRPVWHCQFIQCGNAISGDPQSSYGATMELHNVLFSQCTVAVRNNPAYWYGSCLGIVGEQVTADQVTALMTNTCYYGGPASALTNSILTGVGSLGVTVNLVNTVNLSTNTGIYASVGAGNYYLAAGSTNRNAGATNLSATLLAELKSKTTYPPVTISGTLSGATTLSPQAQRDTDTPDLGYHYDPLDYLLNNVAMGGPTLTLTNGVAVSLIGSSGVSLNGSSFVSEGTPARLNHVVRPHCVQEQSLNQGAGGFYTQSYYYPTLIHCRFTEFVGYGLSLGAQGAGIASEFSFRDCVLHNFPIQVDTFYTDASAVASVFLTNNIFDRCALGFIKEFNSYTYSPTVTLISYNNLFRGGSCYLSYSADGSSLDTEWQLKDNLCDAVALSVGNLDASLVHVSNNGFITNTANPWGGTGNLINLQRDYQTGSLGTCYYPSTGGTYSLFNLIDAGSQTAPDVGLYHYTTQTNGIYFKELTSQVDIGYHYVEVNGNGVPLDEDSDGTPDYLEDVNGNGEVNSGETDWNVATGATDLGLRVIITEPKRSANLP